MSTRPVHVRVGEHTVVVMAEELDVEDREDEEGPVADRSPSLTEAIAAAAAATEEAARAFLREGTVSVTVEAGLEFAIETGALVSVLGKASSSSSLKIIVTYERANLSRLSD
ncbi:CU044_2847 family protein [Promicromonospora sp. NFX87]|uniref:CU044_2847 family protein n=1 Tax=Promicromonospora sp. NFX87 TaxID=3402691 RepID=UPI003AFAB31F